MGKLSDRKNKNIFKDIQKQKKSALHNYKVTNIPLDKCIDNPYQPRIQIDKDELEQLANSIKENGLMQPITVTQYGQDDQYTILYGHRRYYAHKLLKLDTIKAFYVDEISKKDLMVQAIVENEQRSDLDIIEISRSLHKLKQSSPSNPYTQDQLSKMTGISQDKISRYLSFDKLSSKILEDLKTNDMKALSALAKVSNHKVQEDIYNQFIKGGSRELLFYQIKEYFKKPTNRNYGDAIIKNSKVNMAFHPSKELTKKGKWDIYSKFAKEKFEALEEELKQKEQELLH